MNICVLLFLEVDSTDWNYSEFGFRKARSKIADIKATTPPKPNARDREIVPRDFTHY